jgi:hypothetical protein
MTKTVGILLLDKVKIIANRFYWTDLNHFVKVELDVHWSINKCITLKSKILCHW